MTHFSVSEPSDQEKQLQELVFGKDVIAATSERQQSTAVKVIMILIYVAHGIISFLFVGKLRPVDASL